MKNFIICSAVFFGIHSCSAIRAKLATTYYEEEISAEGDCIKGGNCYTPCHLKHEHYEGVCPQGD